MSIVGGEIYDNDNSEGADVEETNDLDRWQYYEGKEKKL